MLLVTPVATIPVVNKLKVSVPRGQKDECKWDSFPRFALFCKLELQLIHRDEGQNECCIVEC